MQNQSDFSRQPDLIGLAHQTQLQTVQIPTLPAEAFKVAYGQWCSKHNVVHDDQVLQINGERINLHRLHQEVVAAGTVYRVSLSSLVI